LHEYARYDDIAVLVVAFVIEVRPEHPYTSNEDCILRSDISKDPTTLVNAIVLILSNVSEYSLTLYVGPAPVIVYIMDGVFDATTFSPLKFQTPTPGDLTIVVVGLLESTVNSSVLFALLFDLKK
jgi:hypothetical protein